MYASRWNENFEKSRNSILQKLEYIKQSFKANLDEGKTTFKFKQVCG